MRTQQRLLNVLFGSNRAVQIGLAGILASITACGIPKLRYASPCHELPTSFQIPPADIHSSPYLSDPSISNSAHSQNGAVIAPQTPLSETSLATFVSPPTPAENPTSAPSANSAETVHEAQAFSLPNTVPPTSFPPPDQAPNHVLLNGGGWQANAPSTESSALIARFELFQDPSLSGLIEEAILGNQELKILAEEVQIACYEVQARSGAYRPMLDYGAGVGVEKSGRFTRAGAVEEQLEVRPGRAFPDPVPDFLVGTTVSWEIDIWKRLRNSQRAAAMRYLGTQEGRNYVVTRLVAEISENYFQLLALDNRMMALNQTIAIQEKSLEIAKAKKEAARETELAVQRFLAEVQKNQSQRMIIEQQIIETENRLNRLLGRYPQRIVRPSIDMTALPLQTLSRGLPSELLRNRTDIRQAEREVQACGLDLQVAKARFYPSLGLSAGVGFRAFNPSYLLTTPDSLIYNVGGDLVGPLINKRAIQAEYKTANARQLQSIYNYQQTVINAFTEVVNFMAKIENYGKSIDLKKSQLDSLEKSVDAANKLFQNARAEYMEVLLAQRDLMEVRMILIETKQEQLSAFVNAYRALGGGCF